MQKSKPTNWLIKKSHEPLDKLQQKLAHTLLDLSILFHGLILVQAVLMCPTKEARKPPLKLI